MLRDENGDISSKWLLPLMAIIVAVTGGTLTFAWGALERVSHVERDQAASLVRAEANKDDIRDLSRRIERADERITNLHNYIMTLPVKPGSFIPGLNRRGDLSPIIK
jgi:hypothetical protein